MFLKLGHFLYMKEEEYKKFEVELAYARYMGKKKMKSSYLPAF